MITLLRSRALRAGLALLVAVVCDTPAGANVYVSNVRANDSEERTVLSRPGRTVTLSYILNEAASEGVTIEMVSTNQIAVWKMSVPAGASGTLKGTNTLTWNGLADDGSYPAFGLYRARLTAASAGYPEWTQLTADTNCAVYQCRGLAVNRNAPSLYYGRVFVGNATAGAGAATNFLDRLGIQLRNADGSPATPVAFSTGGYAWSGQGWSPWKMCVGPDDRLYVNDWSFYGKIFSWDQALSSASRQAVRRSDNNPATPPPPPDGPIRGRQGNLSGVLVTSDGGGQYLWTADVVSGGWGIARWPLNPAGVVPTNVFPNIIVRATATHFGITGTDLDDSAFDLDIDAAGNIYAVAEPWDTPVYQDKVFKFPPFAGLELTNALWKIGADTLRVDKRDACAVAVNPAGTLVAVALQTSAKTLLLDAATGATSGAVNTDGHPQKAVAWDNAGNLYTAHDGPSGGYGAWRCWSPPGTNGAVTVSAQTIFLHNYPEFTAAYEQGGLIRIEFESGPQDGVERFTLQTGDRPDGVFADTTATIEVMGAGLFRTALPLPSGQRQYYRIMAKPF